MFDPAEVQVNESEIIADLMLEEDAWIAKMLS